jgi:hypothetical protein
MRAQLKWILTLVAVAVVCVGAAPALAVDGSLDGMTFIGETGVVGEKGDPEEFVFADGDFDPLACHQWGFDATPYTETETEDGDIHFVAEHTNEDGDRMRWEGIVAGDSLAGSMLYWQGEKPPVEYWFEAEAKAASE